MKSIVLLVSFGFFLVAGIGAAGAGLRTERLEIATPNGTHAFNVELATTPDQQATGLMFRRRMAADAGMLFLYEPGRHVTMWMKNTYIPLDMLFIGPQGRILHIVERTVPLSNELISSKSAVRAVLELNAGTVSRLGISTGDRVRHEAFRMP